MSDKSNQQISNLMDGELEVNASKFLLKRMASDDSLSQSWSNYHLIKSCLQKETAEPLVVDIAARVTKQLNKGHSKSLLDEPTNYVPKINRWLKPIMGLGIAASVAFMSVTLLQNQQTDSNDLPIIVNNDSAIQLTNPLVKPINATVVTGSNTLVPPPSLSRFPSVSTENSRKMNQGYSYSANTPYIIIINQAAHNQYNHLSPIQVKDISD